MIISGSFSRQRTSQSRYLLNSHNSSKQARSLGHSSSNTPSLCLSPMFIDVYNQEKMCVSGVLTLYHNSDFCLAVLESTWDMRHLPAFLVVRLQLHAFVTEHDSDISHLHKHSPLSTLRCPFPFGPFLHPRRWTWCSCTRPFPRWIQQLEWWSLLRLTSSDTKWWSYQPHPNPTSKCASLGYPTSGPKPCWTACPCCLKVRDFFRCTHKGRKKRTWAKRNKSRWSQC